ncbi:MAG: hypothetical protein P9L99_13990 [Candidatus Lernaella stagnicola]|nr:hypothetical protein [Candidatus Lernaella stagnicola]
MKRMIYAVVFVLAMAAVAHAGFVIDTVEEGDTGYFTEIALTSDDRPGICYLNKDNYAAHYAEWTGAAWETETVDADGNVGSNCGIFFDAADDPHMAYRDDGDGKVRYAAWDGDSWNIRVIDKAFPTGTGLAVAHDGDYWLRTASVQTNVEEIAYTYMNAIGPHTKYVGGDLYTIGGEALGLAVTPDGQSIVSWYYPDTNCRAMWLARGHTAGWDFKLVDGDESWDVIGRYSDVQVDATGGIHLVYLNEDKGALYYARGTWNNLHTDQMVTGVGTSFDQSLDGDGNPHVCFVHEASGALLYANLNDKGWWHIYKVDDAAGRDCSLAVDSAGVVTIAYRGAHPSPLFVARGDESGLPDLGGDDDDDATDDDASDDDVGPGDDDASGDDDATDDDEAADDDDTAGDDDTSGDDDMFCGC